jgi:uncharacterized protein (DUF305 family)
MRNLVKIGLVLASLSATSFAEPASKTSADATGDMGDAMATMHSRMGAVSKTKDPDQDFVAMMIPHHQGAVDMATVYLKKGKDPEIRKLAEKIISAQKEEIAFLQNWQKAHPTSGAAH